MDSRAQLNQQIDEAVKTLGLDAELNLDKLERLTQRERKITKELIQSAYNQKTPSVDDEEYDELELTELNRAYHLLNTELKKPNSDHAARSHFISNNPLAIKWLKNLSKLKNTDQSFIQMLSGSQLVIEIKDNKSQNTVQGHPIFLKDLEHTLPISLTLDRQHFKIKPSVLYDALIYAILHLTNGESLLPNSNNDKDNNAQFLATITIDKKEFKFYIPRTNSVCVSEKMDMLRVLLDLNLLMSGHGLPYDDSSFSLTNLSFTIKSSSISYMLKLLSTTKEMQKDDGLDHSESEPLLIRIANEITDRELLFQKIIPLLHDGKKLQKPILTQELLSKEIKSLTAKNQILLLGEIYHFIQKNIKNHYTYEAPIFFMDSGRDIANSQIKMLSDMLINIVRITQDRFSLQKSLDNNDVYNLINFDSSKNTVRDLDEKPTDCKTELDLLMSKQNQSAIANFSVVSNRSDQSSNRSDQPIPLTSIQKKKK